MLVEYGHFWVFLNRLVRVIPAQAGRSLPIRGMAPVALYIHSFCMFISLLAGEMINRSDTANAPLPGDSSASFAPQDGAGVVPGWMRKDGC